jgi:HTH-type transcriptional regulator / antitoxin HipB
MPAIRAKADIGQLLRARRETQGLTLRELAARSGTGRRLLIDLEHGRRDVTLDNLLGILRALGFELRVEDPAASLALPTQTFALDRKGNKRVKDSKKERSGGTFTEKTQVARTHYVLPSPIRPESHRQDLASAVYPHVSSILHQLRAKLEDDEKVNAHNRNRYSTLLERPGSQATPKKRSKRRREAQGSNVRSRRK